jgi:hypothetical protein
MQAEGERDTTDDRPTDRSTVVLLVLVLALAVVVAVLATVLVLRGRDDDHATPRPQPTPTTTSTTSVTAAPTSGTPSIPTLSVEEARSVVWPQPGDGTVYDDPVDAAAVMATRLARFTSPLIGPFQRGDARSGEVEIRAASNGPVTTVLLRQLSDGHWYVLGASTPDLRLESPGVGATIGSPVTVSGRSTSFEGLVLVTVLRQGDPNPLGQLPVQGGANGTVAPFTGQVHYDAPDVGTAGAVLLSTESAEDGRVWQATIVPVQLAGA